MDLFGFFRFSLFFAFFFVFCGQAISGEVFYGPGFDGISLSEFVLFANRPLSESNIKCSGKKDIACVSDYLKCLKKILKKEPEFRSQDAILDLRRWRLKQHIKCIIGEQALPESDAFVYRLPLYLEWEGMADGPEAEANYAERWIMERPESVINPFVHIFAAHRLRAAFEIYFKGKDENSMSVSGDSYRKHMSAVSSSKNEKIRCVAEDLEALSHVYLPCPIKP